MNLLILGGMSPRNKEYIRQAAKAFTPMFDKVMAHNYAHWQNAEAQMNLEQELVALQAKTRELGANYSIFAKSAGAVLSLKGIAKGVLQPKTALFAGLPLAFANGQNLPLNEWLIALNCPTIFVQNSHDPTASQNWSSFCANTHPGNYANQSNSQETHTTTPTFRS